MATLGGGVDHIRIESECDQLSGLVPKQKQICKKSVEIMSAVRAGARGAIEECQFQFRSRRWNCSTLYTNSSVFGKIVNVGELLIYVYAYIIIIGLITKNLYCAAR